LVGYGFAQCANGLGPEIVWLAGGAGAALAATAGTPTAATATTTNAECLKRARIANSSTFLGRKIYGG
jgi:hypothetical protein